MATGAFLRHLWPPSENTDLEVRSPPLSHLSGGLPAYGPRDSCRHRLFQIVGHSPLVGQEIKLADCSQSFKKCSGIEKKMLTGSCMKTRLGRRNLLQLHVVHFSQAPKVVRCTVISQQLSRKTPASQTTTKALNDRPSGGHRRAQQPPDTCSSSV